MQAWSTHGWSMGIPCEQQLMWIAECVIVPQTTKEDLFFLLSQADPCPSMSAGFSRPVPRGLLWPYRNCDRPSLADMVHRRYEGKLDRCLVFTSRFL